MENRSRLEAVALRIAHAYLKSSGKKFTPREIGETAKQIIDGLDDW